MLMLHENRFVFSQQLDSVLIPVVVMGVGHDHRINIQQGVDSKRQFNHRVADLSAGGAWETRIGILWCQQWVNQKALTCVGD
ncbi:hypothetical protein D3C79_930890 [compost metagenome]